MSYTVPTQVRIPRPGDFVYRRPIIVGGVYDDPVAKSGVQDLASTQLALIGNLGHPIVCDSPNVDVSIDTSNNIIAVYRFPVPKYLTQDTGGPTGRHSLLVNITGKTSTGTWGVAVTTSAGGATSVGGGTTTTSTVTAEAPINHGPYDEYLLVKIFGSTSATFSYYNVAAWILPSSGALDGDEIYVQDKITPVDNVDEIAEDLPLTVPAVRNLVQANDVMWRYNVRPVVNFCVVKNYGTALAGTSPSGTGVEIVLGESEVTGRKRSWQWIYFPRPGIDRLRVYWDGAYTTAQCNCMLNFIGQTAENAGSDDWGAFAVTDTNYLDTTAWGSTFDIPVPVGPGPFFLELRAKHVTSSTAVANIAALSIYEMGENT